MGIKKLRIKGYADGDVIILRWEKPAAQVSELINLGLPELAHPLGWASETTRGRHTRRRQPADAGCTARQGSLSIIDISEFPHILP